MPDFTGSLIDHLNIAVPDLPRSLAFYEPVLAVLGIVKLLEVPADPAAGQLEMHGFGRHPKPFFWLVADGTVGSNMHLAFTADDRATVRAFHDAALAAGGRSLLEPGQRPEYHADYYGAFVLDPDGVNVEAVCHQPEQPSSTAPRP
ncbi:VOC family protein [Mycolicibacterium arseniciresistens]|uniref:VOC family protein n=1 Tax=Mycolicibacterium arseniciresistens TaxID=3062257 RepID=A0ABT8UMU9_9MYCO|nr:VOC family protein [Mycolicibacterium arseniciresistens]MDO3639138.1 VOC family protein [Mycolicibacterium arseniciresistens]